jgi:hypothetical protein
VKLLTTTALFVASVILLGCGGDNSKVETAKEVLTSHKWYSSKNCENHQESNYFIFKDKQMTVITYDNPNFEGESVDETSALEYKEHEIYLTLDGEDGKCLVSSDSDKTWVSLQCVSLEGSGELTAALYKTKDDAIKNNKELCLEEE